MQKPSHDFNDEDRRVARRWRLVTVGFYGSIVTGLILYGAYSPSSDVNYASAQPAPSASHVTAGQR
jgi:hypothetical protein